MGTMEELNPHERLLVARHRARQKLQEAARAVGCTPDTLSAIEGGRRPTGRVAAGIERVYGIPAACWYQGSEERADG
jgi:transcriptional regulator with XRE-family HTH domain